MFHAFARFAATEIQNIQVGDGEPLRARDIPLYMVLPRLFTCPTTTTHNFKIGTTRLVTPLCTVLYII